MPPAQLTAFSLLAPPYGALLPLDDEEEFPEHPRAFRGAALVWSLGQGGSEAHLEKAATRPGGLPLLVLFPPSPRIARLRSRMLELVEETRPLGILPYHPFPEATELQMLLRQGPAFLPGDSLDYLWWRGLQTRAGDPSADSKDRRALGGTADAGRSVAQRLPVATRARAPVSRPRASGALTLAPVLPDPAGVRATPDLGAFALPGGPLPRIPGWIHAQQPDGTNDRRKTVARHGSGSVGSGSSNPGCGPSGTAGASSRGCDGFPEQDIPSRPRAGVSCRRRGQQVRSGAE
jgi:hypothetical protein